ncbi:MAG: bile acid:sodium symporter [Acidobacteria bacterium RIFCSPLOWO2_02_FULL_59_13]|nr:MAG: bile acid:sodium symporter [Acidobacteria bacterium RIFCSPLOWO2_02_FULL_59_13]
MGFATASNLLVGLFPLWAVAATTVALAWPDRLTPLGPAIVPLLGVVMFGMGLTLTARDFLAVARRPLLIAGGTALQFGIMPLAAWIVGHSLSLPPELLVGLILVGACPGGTASNVICFLARGDVALSVTLTTVSTLLAVLLTPALTWLYVGELVPVPVLSMLLSILQVVILPVVAGVVVNHLFGARFAYLRGSFPLISVAAIVVIIAIVVALNAGQAAVLAWPVVMAVALHNSLGLAAGYSLPWLFGFDARICRTLAIEVGMQNSGLGVALATQFFSAAAALPGAVFSVWHNLSGSLLAAYWGRRETTRNSE